MLLLLIAGFSIWLNLPTQNTGNDLLPTPISEPDFNWNWIVAAGFCVAAICSLYYFGAGDFLKLIIEPLKKLIPLVAIICLLAIWLGLEDLGKIGDGIGDSLVEATDGDGVLFQHKDPTKFKTYGGTAASPAVLPQLRVGQVATYLIDGPVMVKTPPYGRRCTVWEDPVDLIASSPALGIYQPSGAAATISVLIKPAGTGPCPNPKTLKRVAPKQPGVTEAAL